MNTHSYIGLACLTTKQEPPQRRLSQTKDIIWTFYVSSLARLLSDSLVKDDSNSFFSAIGFMRLQQNLITTLVAMVIAFWRSAKNLNFYGTWKTSLKSGPNGDRFQNLSSAIFIRFQQNVLRKLSVMG